MAPPTWPPHNQADHHQHPVDFRAPPPSPVAATRSCSSVANDHVLTDFLQSTLRVPNLVLPDHIFPKLSTSRSLDHDDEGDNVPSMDFRSLSPCPSRAARDAIAESLDRIGCFQLTNHGIDGEIVRLAVSRAADIFWLSAEQKERAVRSAEMACGFEEVCGGKEEEEEEEEVIDMFEEFVWCNRDDELRLKMEGIWPHGYAKFREEMKSLTSAMENISRAILLALLQDHDDHQPLISTIHADHENDDLGAVNRKQLCTNGSSICYIHKHQNHRHRITRPEGDRISISSALRHDVVRMIVRGSDCPHALCLHLFGEDCSEFHIYSKKGWVSFVPKQCALIVTSGDQTQAWTGSQCKYVIGRPIYTENESHHQFISMAFLYTDPSINSNSGLLTSDKYSTIASPDKDHRNIISIQQQLVFAVLLTFSCQFSLYVYRLFYKLLSD